MRRAFQFWLWWTTLVPALLIPRFVCGQGNGTIMVDGVKYPFTFADLQRAIADCTAISTCSGVDARALTGLVNTASTSIVLSKRMVLLLGDVTIASTANPIVDIRSNGVQIIGTGAFYAGNVAGTVLKDNSNNTSTTTISINQPNIISGVTVKNLNLMVTQGKNSGDAISLYNAQRNTFDDIFIDGHVTPGTDAIRLSGQDYFNSFRRIATSAGNQSFEISGTSNFNWLEDSTVGNAGLGAAIKLGPNASNNVIRNVDIEGCTGGPGAVDVLGDFNILDSLHIEGAGRVRPIHINGTSTVVRDTAVDSSSDYGIVVDSGAADTVIDSVRFTRNPSGSVQVVAKAQRTRIANGFSTDSVFLTDAGTNTYVWPKEKDH